MRLTALRQPDDISKPMTTKQMKPPGLCNDPYTTNPCICNPTPGNTGKRGRTKRRCEPYGGAAQAPSQTARFGPLPEPSYRNSRTGTTQIPPKAAPITRQTAHTNTLPRPPSIHPGSGTILAGKCRAPRALRRVGAPCMHTRKMLITTHCMN